MNTIVEVQRQPSPARRPQSLAWVGNTLWMGALSTRRIHALDPNSLAVRWECEAPGSPWGMTAVADARGEPGGFELRLVCGEAPDDSRIIRRCIPYLGFDTAYRIPCPEDTGSQLGYDGERLHLSQWYKQRILALDEDGAVVGEVRCPHQICGQVVVEGVFYLVATDDETTDDYYLTRIDARAAKPIVRDLARIPFPARALAFDGSHFWTSHREQSEIVCFARPD